MCVTGDTAGVAIPSILFNSISKFSFIFLIVTFEYRYDVVQKNATDH